MSAVWLCKSRENKDKTLPDRQYKLNIINPLSVGQFVIMDLGCVPYHRVSFVLHHGFLRFLQGAHEISPLGCHGLLAPRLIDHGHGRPEGCRSRMGGTVLARTVLYCS